MSYNPSIVTLFTHYVDSLDDTNELLFHTSDMLNGPNTARVRKTKDILTAFYTSFNNDYSDQTFTTSTSAILHILSTIEVPYNLYITKPIHEEYTNSIGLVLHRSRYERISSVSHAQLYDVDGIL